MSKSIIYRRFTTPRFFRPPNGPRSWKSTLLEKQKLAILITQLFPLPSAKIWKFRLIQLWLLLVKQSLLLMQSGLSPQSTTSHPWNSEKLAWLAFSCPWLVWYTWYFCPSKTSFTFSSVTNAGPHGNSLLFTRPLAIYPYTSRWWFYSCSCQLTLLGQMEKWC